MLIVFEGVDASGKATQSERVFEYLKTKYDTRKISFPDYDSPSSALVKMYLAGEFGEKPEDVSPYAASAFYAVDRYASFKKDWGGFLADGGTLVADRYVTSNMIHQAAKIKDTAEKDKYLHWIYDFEYEKLALPKPDKVIFLDMPPHFARELMRERANKITGEAEKDIHEKDAEYLRRAYENAVYVAEKFGWERIICAKDSVRSIEDITNEIIERIGL
ncbi:MAG: thymidylate kinase [Clostridia bacterium]|nr:thymidylate kinase [Clostridia bacterium]